MEFGYYIRRAETYENMVEMAQYAEELGLYGVFLNDHVQSMSQRGMNPILEAWTAMAGIGAHTKRIRLGHIVLFNSLRNPAFLAKSVSTLDQMSGGARASILMTKDVRPKILQGMVTYNLHHDVRHGVNQCKHPPG